ncbi:hypothetical protein AKO1_003910 [Acrasis kona]|uniref:Uncharacterized protein n=1 Tax=Acrasis kona TaxID=1008807 RepID=A0AAW2ZK95_9EUKA
MNLAGPQGFFVEDYDVPKLKLFMRIMSRSLTHNRGYSFPELRIRGVCRFEKPMEDMDTAYHTTTLLNKDTFALYNDDTEAVELYDVDCLRKFKQIKVEETGSIRHSLNTDFVVLNRTDRRFLDWKTSSVLDYRNTKYNLLLYINKGYVHVEESDGRMLIYESNQAGPELNKSILKLGYRDLNSYYISTILVADSETILLLVRDLTESALHYIHVIDIFNKKLKFALGPNIAGRFFFVINESLVAVRSQEELKIFNFRDGSLYKVLFSTKERHSHKSWEGVSELISIMPIGRQCILRYYKKRLGKIVPKLDVLCWVNNEVVRGYQLPSGKFESKFDPSCNTMMLVGINTAYFYKIVSDEVDIQSCGLINSLKDRAFHDVAIITQSSCTYGYWISEFENKRRKIYNTS